MQREKKLKFHKKNSRKSVNYGMVNEMGVESYES